MLHTRRIFAALAATAAGALLVAGCGDSAGGPPWDARAVAASQQDTGIIPVLVNSNVGVGETRLAFGLFRSDQSLLDDAVVSARLFRLADEPDSNPDVAEPAGEFELRPVTLVQGLEHIHGDGSVHSHVGSSATMYVRSAPLDQPGWWGALLDVESDEMDVEGLQLRFFVQEHTSEPAIGDAAPATEQQTVADAPLEDLDSSNPPNEALHDRTIADALTESKPLVVAFATPAFCQTQFCGPVMETVVLPAWEQYRDRVVFIHVEPWDLAQARQGTLVPVDAVREWGLLSEPFVFVIDAEGRIAAKFEGIVDADELEAAIQDVLAGD